jgi:hypothetical protein
MRSLPGGAGGAPCWGIRKDPKLLGGHGQLLKAFLLSIVVKTQ